MTEEMKMSREESEAVADGSVKRIAQIAKMAKEYYRAINNGINSTEMYMIGVDTILAGFQLIGRSNDMDLLDVDGRIAMIKATLKVVNDVLEKTYLDPKVVAGMVAKAALEHANREGIKSQIVK